MHPQGPACWSSAPRLQDLIHEHPSGHAGGDVDHHVRGRLLLRGPLSDRSRPPAQERVRDHFGDRGRVERLTGGRSELTAEHSTEDLERSERVEGSDVDALGVENAVVRHRISFRLRLGFLEILLRSASRVRVPGARPSASSRSTSPPLTISLYAPSMCSRVRAGSRSMASKLPLASLALDHRYASYAL